MPPRSTKRPAPQGSLLDSDTSAFTNDSPEDVAGAPLAARMRPRSFDDYVGQEHLVGPGRLLRRLVENGQLPSIILWGPPGSGKTTLARIIAAQTDAHFVALSAVSAGVADIRRVMAEARALKLIPRPILTPADDERVDASTTVTPSPRKKKGPGDEAAPLPLSVDTAQGPRDEVPTAALPLSEIGEGAGGRGSPGPRPPAPAVPRTILFIDEIHRFNKAQQDAVLPYVEDGTVTLIGATTENPSFEVIGPLLSRSRVFTLKALEEPQLAELLRRAIEDPDRGLGALNVQIDDDALEALAASVGGDARIALNALEAAAMSVIPTSARTRHRTNHDGVELKANNSPSPRKEKGLGDEVSGSLTFSEIGEGAGGRGAPGASPAPDPRPQTPARITRSVIEEALQHRTYLYDRQGDSHYDTISAFIKSLRGSDPDAALYWLARMIEAGEDPLFIVRRMVILASEDVGLADPAALTVATACQNAVHFIGMPEGFYPLAQCALYLALAPKSNSVGTSYGKALADVEATRNDPVPLHLRNAVTGLMRGMGYGTGYQYAHNYEGGVAPEQTYLPDRLKGHKYYVPRNIGRERDLAARHAEAQRSRPAPAPPQTYRSAPPPSSNPHDEKRRPAPPRPGPTTRPAPPIRSSAPKPAED